MRVSRFTEDDGFTRLGTVYFRLRDEAKGLLFRLSWRKNCRDLSRRVSWLEGQERRRMKERDAGAAALEGERRIDELEPARHQLKMLADHHLVERLNADHLREQAERQRDNFERIARENAEAKHALWLWRNKHEPLLEKVPELVEAALYATTGAGWTGSLGPELDTTISVEAYRRLYAAACAVRQEQP